MTHATPITLLMFGTIAIALVVAIVMLTRFRKRHDSHPMDGVRERNIDEIRNDAPPER